MPDQEKKRLTPFEIRKIALGIAFATLADILLACAFPEIKVFSTLALVGTLTTMLVAGGADSFPS